MSFLTQESQAHFSHLYENETKQILLERLPKVLGTFNLRPEPSGMRFLNYSKFNLQRILQRPSRFCRNPEFVETCTETKKKIEALAQRYLEHNCFEKFPSKTSIFLLKKDSITSVFLKVFQNFYGTVIPWKIFFGILKFYITTLSFLCIVVEEKEGYLDKLDNDFSTLIGQILKFDELQIDILTQIDPQLLTKFDLVKAEIEVCSPKVYLEPSRTPKMDLLCKNS